MRQFTLFTYLRPFLETVTHVGASAPFLLFLGMGIVGFVGTTFIENLLKNGLHQTLIVIPALMALIALALIAFGSSAALTAILLSVWGLIGTSAPVVWWTWFARTLPKDAEAGGGLMVAIVQLAIGFGASVGGVFFDMSGYQATFGISSGLLVVAADLAIFTGRANSSSRQTAKQVDTATMLTTESCRGDYVRGEYHILWKDSVRYRRRRWSWPRNRSLIYKRTVPPEND